MRLLLSKHAALMGSKRHNSSCKGSLKPQGPDARKPFLLERKGAKAKNRHTGGF